MTARAARRRATPVGRSNSGCAASPVESSIDTPAMPVSMAARTFCATPSGLSAKPLSKSALTGSSVAATSARKYASTVGRGICPSAQPCDHAAPELVEASALKPSCASQCAEPTSHGLGMTKQPLACSWRKAARRAAIAVGVGNMA